MFSNSGGRRSRLKGGSWILVGVDLNVIGAPFGCHFNSICNLLRFQLPSIWILVGSYLGSSWIVFGFHLDSMWIPFGFYFDPIGIRLGFHLVTACVTFEFHSDSAPIRAPVGYHVGSIWLQLLVLIGLQWDSC